ncbi:MAG: TonB-dependent receptor plug domain-containing protein, partial [Planctomycetes bacterium]|nr:TonB-dependent receptor plug domain-containing protein [Planctomycetota bacterium]
MTKALRLLPLLGIACTGAGFAQEDSEDEYPEEPAQLEHVIVTGSRIERMDYAGPAPVSIYTRVSIEQSGVNTLGEFFRDLPQSLAPASEVSPGSGLSGAAYIDLRGIGIDNTLTLLNGKRVAGYARNGASDSFVDINAIPVAAIERVEILKDGASAIYGADAVAGVVNIILRDRFDGLMVDGGYLTSTEGDGEEWSADLIWGWNDDDTSLVTTLSWFDKSPILARDRE